MYTYNPISVTLISINVIFYSIMKLKLIWKLLRKNKFQGVIVTMYSLDIVSITVDTKAWRRDK